MEEKGQLLCELWLAQRLINFKDDVKKVAALFKTPYEVYECDFSEDEYQDISEKCIAALKDKNLTEANNLLNYCEQHNIARVRIGSPYYPSALYDIPDPPYLLFCKGNVGLLRSEALISMVGTRTMTTAGKYSAFRMAYELASSGMCIVSGMALGNDSMCHAGAVAAGGKTIAVLGSGIDVVYPSQHATLYHHLVRNGHLVISEFLPGTRPYGHNFPHRNRIIAGISFGTVVVEASEKSGSLITADLAEGYGRIVFAMPGYSYTASAAGSNKLTQQGAVVTTDSATVIREYNYVKGTGTVRRRRAQVSLEACERAIEELRLETRVVDPPTDIIRLDPEIFFVSEKEPDAFPFRIKQELTDAPDSTKRAKVKRSKKKSTQGDAEEAVRDEAPGLPENDEIPEKSESIELEAADNAVLPDIRMLCGACEELGVTVDDGIARVCEVISRGDVVDAESLSREGCRTDVALQVLSILSSAGMLTEDAGGKFKLCKITE